MKLQFLSVLALGAALSTPLLAEERSTIPGPSATGGMVMPLVHLDTVNQSLSFSLMGPDTLTMQNLQGYFPGDTFSASASSYSWYSLLDPSGSHLPFSSQFGFTFGSGELSSLPADSVIVITPLSMSAGLTGYYYDFGGMGGGGGGDIFLEFGPEAPNNYALGDANGLAMWHPLFIASNGPGLYSATFSIYLEDASGNPAAGWTGDTITLNWIVTEPIPEPSTYLLVGSALALAGLCRQRSKRS